MVRLIRLREKLAVDNVARLRVSADRKHVHIACWGGTHAGLSRWERATGRGEQIFKEELFDTETLVPLNTCSADLSFAVAGAPAG